MKLDFAEIKKSTDLAAVIRSYGIELKKSGRDYVGLCPFHDDKTPSLRVTPSKGLFRCPACGATGNVIQFVAKIEKISDREAAQKLLGNIPGVKRGSEIEKEKPIAVPDSKLLAAAIEHYHQSLLSRDRRGIEYLNKRGLGDVEMIRHFKIGFVNGSLKEKLSVAQQQKLACLFNEKGNERYYLRVVVPIFDERGEPVGLYGRSIQPEAQVKHLYLEGQHRAVWNAAAFAAYPDELIVTESVFDGLAVFAAGKKNVSCAYGAGGWTPHHDRLLEKHRVKKVILAYDGDERGREAAKELALKLEKQGVSAHRIHWPEGVKDACDYFTYHRDNDTQGTAESFTHLLAVAPKLGQSKPAKASVTLAERTDDGALFENGNVSYRIKGLGNNNLRVVLTAKNGSATHIDNIDLYGARSRKNFAAAVAARLQADAKKIEEDLLALLDQLEALQAEAAQPEAVAAPELTDAEKKEALRLLQSSRLLDRIASDLETVGYVGETRNKKLAYLIGTSRRLPKPLSGIFRAQSGCGKSFLMECVAGLMPPEDVHYFSRLTPQALYYLEPEELKQKLLIVDERDGSEESEYPIRTLQTRRVLKLAVPVKDPNSGRIKTHVLEIHGPIAYMESTTSEHINPENANRCFELYLDESEAQTRAIFAAQRKARTLEGWQSGSKKKKVLRVHHNAQRLLKPIAVMIPYVDHIEFPAAWLRGRRDYDRFLSLIEGVAFLHQMQRQRGDIDGEPYIEASLDDYAIAYDLAHVVFAQSTGDLPKPVADFLEQVEAVVKTTAKKEKTAVSTFTFSRRFVREATRLPDHIVKRYMRQIEELEYVQVQRAPSGGSYRYRLVERERPQQIDGLTTPEELEKKSLCDRDKRDKSGTDELFRFGR
jgi:DNA primase